MKVKRPSLKGKKGYGYLGHFKQDKVVRAGHNWAWSSLFENLGEAAESSAATSTTADTAASAAASEIAAQQAGQSSLQSAGGAIGSAPGSTGKGGLAGTVRNILNIGGKQSTPEYGQEAQGKFDAGLQVVRGLKQAQPEQTPSKRLAGVNAAYQGYTRLMEPKKPV